VVVSVNYKACNVMHILLIMIINVILLAHALQYLALHTLYCHEILGGIHVKWNTFYH